MSSSAVEFLYRALSASVGIVIRTNNPTLARSRLYAAKRLDPEFEALSIKPSSQVPESELWVLRKVPLISSEDPLDVPPSSK